MLGTRGGSAKSEIKQNASRENGKKGGRPRKAAGYSVYLNDEKVYSNPDKNNATDFKRELQKTSFESDRVVIKTERA
jgi:hypothetical protein